MQSMGDRKSMTGVMQETIRTKKKEKKGQEIDDERNY